MSVLTTIDGGKIHILMKCDESHCLTRKAVLLYPTDRGNVNLNQVKTAVSPLAIRKKSYTIMGCTTPLFERLSGYTTFLPLPDEETALVKKR